MNLLVVSIALWVIGFVLNLVGEWMDRPRGAAAEPPSLIGLIIEAIKKMLRMITRIMSAPTLGGKLQALGSFLFYAGVVTFIVYVIQGAK